MKIRTRQRRSGVHTVLFDLWHRQSFDTTEGGAEYSHTDASSGNRQCCNTHTKITVQA